MAEGTSGHCFLNREGQVMILKKEHPEFDKILKELAQADPAENKDR